MELEPTKPFHGSGGEPDKIKSLHWRYMLAKYLRYWVIIWFSVTAYQVIDIGVIQNKHNDNVFGIILTDDNAPTFFLVLLTIMGICVYLIITRYMQKGFRMIYYAHYSYCKCDKTKWWNR